MYEVITRSGKIVAVGFKSREEAKRVRTDKQFVIRSENHPLGRSKFRALRSEVIRDKKGRKTIRIQ